jgi:hypothetical protein
MTRNERGQRFLSSSKMSFEDGGLAVRDPPETVTLDDNITNDWGYFVDCDYTDSDRQTPLPTADADGYVNILRKEQSYGSAFLR